MSSIFDRRSSLCVASSTFVAVSVVITAMLAFYLFQTTPSNSIEQKEGIAVNTMQESTLLTINNHGNGDVITSVGAPKDVFFAKKTKKQRLMTWWMMRRAESKMLT